MDITTLAAWGEFLGGVAVIGSLIYLASQIRQGAKLLRAATVSSTAQIQLGQTEMLVQDPEVARIYWAGLADRDSLPDVDRQRFDPLMWIQMAGHNQRFTFNQDELVGPETRAGLERELRWLFSHAGIRQWWEVWRGHFDDSFSDYVERLIRDGEAAG